MIRCNLVVIKTYQVEATQQFYSSLGLHFEKHRHGKGPLHYAAELGQFVFEIYPLPDNLEIADTSTRLGFQVEQLDDLLTQLPLNQILKEPHQSEWGYQAVVCDPDGRKVELKQRSD